LGCNLGNRKAGGFAGKGRRARDSRVHLNHDDAAVLGIESELNVRPTCIHANGANYLNRCVAQSLILLVGQGLYGRDCDGVSRVNTHRVEVLDRADDEGVVDPVARYLELDFLPAKYALFQQDLMHGAGIEPAHGNVIQLLLIVGNATTSATEGKGGPDDDREADRRRDISNIAELARYA